MPPRLIIEVLGDTSNFERSMKRTGEVAGGLTGVVGRLSIGFGQLVKSTVIIYGLEKAFESLSGAVHAGIDEFKENASIQAQTNAALKSTGGIADVTSKQIRDLSVELSNLSGISDESIRSAENVELAFTNIRDSAGKGNDVFTEATKLIVDFSARTGKDAPAAALLFGKALEDPAKRVGILARAGVVLSESQVKVLKSTEKTQGILAAQKILIADLKVRFDGAAAAAGKTLPGALNILKERFKDLAGSGISRVAGPLRNAAVGLAAFVVQLTNAHGAVAKLDVLGDGLRSLAAKIEAGVKGEVAKINWDAVFAGVKKIGAALERGVVAGITALRSLGARLGSAVKRQIDAINWAAVVGRAGQLAGDAIVAGLNALTAVIRKVKWATVGKAVVDGIVIAIAATAKFLASVDWGKVVEALFRTLKAAIEASNSLMLGIGKEIGKLLFAGIQAGLSAAGNVLEKLAINIALKIIEPFTHIPGFLGGGAFQDIKTQLQATLADMQKTAATGGSAVGTALGAGITAGSQNAFANFRATVVAALTPLSNGGSDPTSDSASSGAVVPGLTPAAADIGQGSATRRKGITASQRNTFFDNRISRLLDQASSGGIQQQISKLKAIGALISARIAATKDVTRKLTLEQTLLDQVTRPLAQDRATVAQNFLDALQLNVDRASATTGLNDDLSTLGALKAGILARIKLVGETNSLEEQLLSVTQQIKSVADQARQGVLDALNFRLTKAEATTSQQDDIAALNALQANLKQQLSVDKGNLALQQQLFDVQQKRQAALAQVRANAGTARNASQFKAIGLTATGDQKIAGVKSLKAELGTISDLISGTFLDTSKTRSVLSGIAEVLSGGLKGVGSKVRAQIKSILDNLHDQLGEAVPKFQKLGHANIFAGLGLDNETEKLIKQRLASVGRGGTVPTGHSAAFVGGSTTWVLNNPHFHGITDLNDLESKLAKKTKNRPLVRRGN